MLTRDKQIKIKYAKMSEKDLSSELKTNSEEFWRCAYTDNSFIKNMKKKYPTIIFDSSINFNVVKESNNEELYTIAYFLKNNPDLFFKLIEKNPEFIDILEEKKLLFIELFQEPEIIKPLIQMESSNSKITNLLNTYLEYPKTNSLIEGERTELIEGERTELINRKKQVTEKINSIIEGFNSPDKQKQDAAIYNLKQFGETGACGLNNITFLDLLEKNSKFKSIMLNPLFVQTLTQIYNENAKIFLENQIKKNPADRSAFNKQVVEVIKIIMVGPRTDFNIQQNIYKICVEDCLNSNEHPESNKNFIKTLMNMVENTPELDKLLIVPIFQVTDNVDSCNNLIKLANLNQDSLNQLARFNIIKNSKGLKNILEKNNPILNDFIIKTSIHNDIIETYLETLETLASKDDNFKKIFDNFKEYKQKHQYEQLQQGNTSMEQQFLPQKQK